MGSCSNRSETKEEKLANHTKTILNTRDFGTDFQLKTGAEIRGILGVEKGNQFIQDMKKYK